jgi:formate hydrogenlyase subunit 6/NADH:ubiquinone oxidoreductase subunit I
VGHFEASQCVVVCPVECISVDPARQEPQEVLLARYLTLTKQVGETGA